MDFKKVQQVKEVALLEEAIGQKEGELKCLDEKATVKQSEFDRYSTKLENVQDKLKATNIKEQFITDNARRYDDDLEFQLPEPKPIMSSKNLS